MSSDYHLPPQIRCEIAEIVRAEIRAAQNPTGTSEFASIRETLRELNLSRTELYRRVRAGELRLLKRGRRSFISRHEIQGFCDRLRRTGEAQQ
jgi:hypothetical protein